MCLSRDLYLSNANYFPVLSINDKSRERYRKLQGMGGIFNQANLNGYDYAGSNPVRFVDPDGKRIDESWV